MIDGILIIKIMGIIFVSFVKMFDFGVKSVRLVIVWIV